MGATAPSSKKAVAQLNAEQCSEHSATLPAIISAACTYGSCCGNADKPGPEGPRGSQLQSPPPEGASYALGSEEKHQAEGAQG